MGNLKRNLWTAVDIIWSLLMVAQIVLAFFLSKDLLPPARPVGWGFIFLSAIFGMFPIFTFRMKGRIEKGKSYMYTTKIVTSGIYSIIRHPQYMAGILINIGLTLISQHWIILIIGVVSIVLIYLDALRADQNLFLKFGKVYVDYAEKVPRLNFIAGIIRLIKRKIKD
jgi:protein-S-isoprenylcysteine O-methyltransferase Ste14